MKHAKFIFAEALARAISETPKSEWGKIVKRVLPLLRRKNMLRSAEEIFRETEKKLMKADGRKNVDIRLAREVSQGELKMLTSAFGARDKVSVVVKPELIAGVKIVVDGERTLDVTLKRRLAKLW